MKKLLRYLPLLTLALIASCTTIEEGIDKAEVLQVSTNKMEIEALGGKEAFTITSYCDWLTETTYEGYDSKWINLSSTKGLSGTKDVTVTFDENKTVDDRYATIVVSNARYGLSLPIEIHQKAGEPFILLDKSEKEVVADGETIGLIVNSNIDYAITSSESWARTSVSSGKKGEQKLSITVDDTPAIEARRATITFAGKEQKATTTFSIIQHKLVPTIELDTESINSIASGATKSVTIEGNISWEASCDADWVTISPANGEKGTSTIKVEVATNTKTTAREAVIKISNSEYKIEKQIAVSQEAFGPVLNVSTEPISAPYMGTTKSITIEGNISWEASCTADWITITPTKGTKDTSTLKIVVAENTKTVAREAVIKINNSEYNVEKQIAVSQVAFGPVLSVSAESISAPVAGATKSVTIEGNISWEASCDADWVTISPANGEKGTSTIKVEVATNTKTTAREAVIKISNSEYKIEKQIAVSQEAFGPVLSVSTGSISAPVAGATKNITIEGNISWEASCDAGWITITPTKGAKGTSTFKVVVAENTKTVARESVIKISNSEYNIEKQIAVSQAAFNPTLNISSGSITAPYTGTTKSITIDGNISWEASCDADWVTISPTKGEKGSSTFKVVVAENTKATAREAVIKICNAEYNIEEKITISQEASLINAILYTSSDGNIVTPYRSSVFGANILSNTYHNGQGVIAFDAPVTSIGDYAFRGCTSLKSVTIPDRVTSIGDYAFYNCTSLTSVTIPDSVTSIGDYAFHACTSLTSVTIPDSVTSIGEGVFEGCSSLTSITIPDSVTSIGDYAFRGCTSLKNVTIPDSVTSIGKSAFWGCKSLTSVTIPNKVTSIGDDAFCDCSSLMAFYGKFASLDNRCLIVNGVLNSFAPAGLTEYTIPDSVTSIGKYAFSDCTSLTSVTIPNSITSIGQWAFNGCTSLTSVYCKPTTPPTGDWYMFLGNASGRKIYVPRNSVEAYKSASDWSIYASDIVGYDF